jgi:CMP-N,N'-diacetyllegionaminic acid synthase
MKVLLVGYGSIGQRHYNVLSSFSHINQIDIVTQQKLRNKRTFSSLENINNLEIYDYFVIASETYKHFHQLKYLESKVQNKLIFCEKPLFDTYRRLEINNKIFVGYVLRFHPLLKKLYSFLKNESILSINVNCGQYLPNWRQNIDYKNSYSSKKSKGGGVLLDLSHEIDYIQWLCSKINEVKSYQLKISDLSIDSDDLTTFIGKTQRKIIVTLSIDYISKIAYRKIILHTLDHTYELDLVVNILIKVNKNGEKEIFKIDTFEYNSMFFTMHNSVFNNQEDLCTYKEALEVMDTIKIIQEQN